MESMSWVRAVSTLSNWVCMISFMVVLFFLCVLFTRVRCGLLLSKFMQVDRG